MQITYFGEGKFQIKGKKATIKTGDKIKIGEFQLDKPGEYEVEGVEAEIIDGITSFHFDELNLAYLERNKRVFSDQEKEKIDNVDILFIPIDSDETSTLKQTLEIIKQIEPIITIPMYYKDLAQFSHLEGISYENLDILKIDKNSINKDENKIVVLNVNS